MTVRLAIHFLTVTFGAVIALALVSFGAISIGAVSAQSGAKLGCVDSNSNGVIDRNEAITVLRAYLGGTSVSPPPLDLAGDFSEIIPFELTPGEKAWEITHEITHDEFGSISVWIIDQYGEYLLLVFADGEYSDTIYFEVGDDSEYDIRPGPAALLIETFNYWTIRETIE